MFIGIFFKNLKFLDNMLKSYQLFYKRESK